MCAYINTMHKSCIYKCSFWATFSDYIKCSLAKFTMLDCILVPEMKRFYVLDIMNWNSHFLIDSEFSCRHFILESKLAELSDSDMPVNKFAYNFVSLPTCLCSAEEMTEFMKTDFDFELDGLLFYYSEVN